MYTVLPQVFYDVAQECIEPFRSCFSRGAAFRHFANFVLSKCVGTYEHGVTDSIRIHSHQMEYPDLNRCYENLIKFFRAGSYSLGDLEKCWMSLMSGSGRAFRKDGRAIITIDGHNAIRCGRYMPAVQKMMQNSESPTKPQVTFGHLWGVCSVLAGSEESKIYPIPLTAEIQSGDEVIRGWETESKMPQKSDERGFVLHEDGEKNFTGSHVERLVRNAIATVRYFGKIYLLGDRYFLSAKTLTLIHGLCPNNEVVFVTKARRNCMAYRIPEKNAEAKKGRGRPRKKGDRVSVSSLFSEKGKFRKATVKIYGKDTELGIRSIETSFRFLKYAIGLMNFHAKRESSVKQEIFARLLMYNFCSRIANTVIVEQNENRELKYQINFTAAIHICFAWLKRQLKLDVRKLIAQYIEPIRPGRMDERNLKPKSFTYFLYRVA